MLCQDAYDTASDNTKYIVRITTTTTMIGTSSSSSSSSLSASASLSSIPAPLALNITHYLHSVAITYWLTFITYIKKQNDHNFHQSVTKIIIYVTNCNKNSIIRDERATFAKYVNSVSNCWLKLVLNKAQWNISWKYFVMWTVLSPLLLHTFSCILCPFINHTSTCHFIVQKYHFTC